MDEHMVTVVIVILARSPDCVTFWIPASVSTATVLCCVRVRSVCSDTFWILVGLAPGSHQVIKLENL